MPWMTSSNRTGFTMMEALVAIALCGLLAIFLVPKLMGVEGSERTTVLIQDTFTSIGELYLAREQDASLAEPEIGSGCEASLFGVYLQDHLRVRSSTTPGSSILCTNGGGPNFCSLEQDYFTLQSGAIVRRICADDTTTPDTLKITLRIPNPNGTNTDFVMVVPEDDAGSGASAGRYTTLYGLTGDPGDCNAVADRVLKVTNTCP